MKVALALLFLTVIQGGVSLWAAILRQAKPGDIATGVVIYDDDRSLRIDISPCSKSEDKIIIVFRRPYQKVALGNVSCKDKTYERVQVIQDESTPAETQGEPGAGESPPDR
jgi:hypothetical protein